MKAMQRRKPLLIILLVLLLASLAVTAQAQEPLTTEEPPNPNASISWPPPVYVLRGEFTIRGSANLPNMTNHYVEFRPLADDLSIPDEDAAWIPATLPSTAAVQDDVLGVWNTATAPDGLYELRLTVNVSGGTPVFHLVSPVRVENTPPPFAITPTAAADQPVLPTLTLPPAVTAAPTFDPNPRATALLSANVRSGDGTNYPIVGSLTEGDVVPIRGISSFGTGWYLIEMPNGRQGWVSPTVVSVSGDTNNLPRVNPPPPPTPTPVPATATPSATVNLVAGNFRFDPPSPRCNETFNIYLDIANFGTTPNTVTGTISIQDFRVADGSFQTGTVGAVPIIQPGQTVNVGPIPITIGTYYNEQHRLVMIVDNGQQIPETNESDNTREAIYTLEKASCP
jgi:uncharacterized protein YgiM (DUF1202 family)